MRLRYERQYRHTCANWVLLFLLSRVLSNLRIMIRASFLSMSSTTKTNREMFSQLVSMLNVLVLLYFPQKYRSTFVGSFLQVSQFKSASLTSMMVSVYLSHRPLMRTYPLVSEQPLSLCTSFSDMLQTWLIRGLFLKQLEEKACCAKYKNLPHTSL